MPKVTLHAAGPADRLLLAGLESLQPVLDQLGEGLVLIGGLAVSAWLHASTLDLPVRATRDVDFGVHRGALGLTTSSRRVKPLLEQHGFVQHPGEEPFRFACETREGRFSLDLLLPKGASRRDPPLIEAGLDSVAAPGLAYALDRGADRLELTLVADERSRTFRLPIATLDAMLVMKAGLASAGVRKPQDRRIADTVDAAMLAAACSVDPGSRTSSTSTTVPTVPHGPSGRSCASSCLSTRFERAYAPWPARNSSVIAMLPFGLTPSSCWAYIQFA
jgi:hypothetical protein